MFFSIAEEILMEDTSAALEQKVQDGEFSNAFHHPIALFCVENQLVCSFITMCFCRESLCSAFHC